MRRFKINKTDLISFLLAMPVICIILNQLLFGNRQWHDYRIWLYSFPYIYLQGVLSWYAHIVVMYWLRERFPQIRQTTLRLTLLIVSHFSLVIISYLFLFHMYDVTGFLGYKLNEDNLRLAIYIGLAKDMVAASLWEGNYTLNLWKKSLHEKETLEQMTIQQEFETLKSQVNPHFLFNCFNTLSSLIAEDTRQAESFLNELSKVYRYLLRNNQDSLSTLQTEVRFIESYYKLLRTRHGEAVQMQIEIDKRYDQYLLPSLTLQLLVENAVKHNVLSKNKPLVIDIFTTTGNKLVVSNNLQLRSKKAPSNRVGLENIRHKYELLSQPGFQVLDEATSFSVVLPLIWSKVVDQKLIATETI
jgi:two-component system LytT family sensor kinase